MKLELRFSFVLLAGVLIAASGCTTETPPLIGGDAQIAASDAGTGGGDGGQATCQPGLVDCGGTCTRVAADSQNCGSCGNACPSGLSCAVGRCDCAAPMLGCDGLCIDPSTDANNCGSCGNVCGSGEICLDGACVVQCEAPNMRCTSPGDDGKPVHVCADLQSDPMNCGTCNTRCSGGATCQAGRCTCAEGQINCSGTCIDPSTDANNCGACLSSCGTEGVCDGGTCTTCGTGLSACGSPARCVDTATSRLHCGACGSACGPGEGCNTGTCACLPGFTDCDGLCANLDGDPHNCGGCGIDCGRGGTCTAGVCACAAGATMCGAECADLDTSAEHCGACGVACATDEACYSGVCRLVNDSCPTAVPVTGDLFMADEELDTGGPVPTGDDCGGGSGDQALYYAVTIPPGQEVAVVTTTGDDLVLFEQAACGDACVRSSDSPQSLTLSNVFGTSDVTRIVGVRMWSSFSDPGSYDIEFTYSTPVVAPNAMCAGATAITADMTITGEDTNSGGPRPSGDGCGSGSGNEALYYAVSVPAGQQVDVVATVSSGSDLVLFEQAACGPDCTFQSDSPESLTLLNPGTADVTRIVGVRKYSSSGSATYDIQFTYSTPTFAANASCTAPTAITGDLTIMGEDTGTGGLRPSGDDCGFGDGAKGLYYAVTIPAGQEVAVTAMTTDSLVIFERGACEDAACVGYSTSESIILTNAFGASDATRIIGVYADSASTNATYDLGFVYSTPVVAPNATCATATPVTADISIMGEDTETGGPRATGTNCGFGSGDKALYYAVTIPAGQTVDVTTSTTSADLVLFEHAACGETDCVSSTDSPESLTLTNTGTSDVTRIVGVRGYNAPGGSFEGGVFDITFTYTP